MHLRLRNAQDRTAPASDSQAMVVEPPPSALPAQPIKEVGRGGALSGGPSTADASSTPSPLASVPSSFVDHRGPKAAKRSRGATPTAEASSDKDEVQEIAPPSSSPSPPAASSSSASPSSSEQHLMSDNNPTTVTTAPLTAAPAAPSAELRNLVPTYVRRETLTAQASIDCRTDDMLLVSVRVDSRHPDGVPMIARQQYKATDESRRKCLVRFLGSSTGLALQCLTIPRYLLLSGNAFTAAIDKLSAEQRAWHEALLAQASQDFSEVRGEHTSPAALADACQWTWAHLDKAVPYPSRDVTSALPLWNSVSSVTSSWADLLGRADNRVLRDNDPSPKSATPFHTYQLLLHGANKLLTHILACQLSSYGLIRAHTPAATRAWDSLLCGDDVSGSPDRTHPTESTDSSSSDSDGGWEQQKARTKRMQQRTRRSQSVTKRVADFRGKHMCGPLADRCLADTELPLLALSSRIQIRAWELRYTSCLLDNFASMGCDTDNLAACPIYNKISTSIDGLTPPHAAWAVKQHNGNAFVTLYVREDTQVLDLVPKLNTKIQQLFPGTQPHISARVSFHRKDARGALLPNSQHHIYLTERPPAVARPTAAPQRSAAAPLRMSASAATPPAPGSWAAAVLSGAKRLSETTTLNHRPTKSFKPSLPAGQSQQPQAQHKQKLQHSTAPQQPQSSGSPAPTTPGVAPSPSAGATIALPGVDFQQSAAWKEMQARSVALEQRWAALEASTASMATMVLDTMHRGLATVTTRLEEQQRMFQSSMESMMAHLQSQFLAQQAVNSSLQLALQDIVQHLHVQTPAAGAEAAQRAPRTSPGSTPTVGSGVTHSSSSRAPTPTSQSSAVATPAHNGEAPSHG
jgi:hypothetical protein